MLVKQKHLSLPRNLAHVTPKWVKEVITNLDLSKMPALDCIPLVVLKKCE